MIILFSLGGEQHCFFCSAAVGSSPPSDAENDSLFVLKVNDFVCVCVCVLLLGACSLFLFWWWGASSLSLFVSFFCHGVERLCVFFFAWRSCSLSLSFSFSLSFSLVLVVGH